MLTTRRFLVLSVLVAAVLMAAPAAHACMGDLCCWTDGREIICFPCLQADSDSLEAEGFTRVPFQTHVEFTSPTTAQITIEDYATTQLEPTNECITAFSPIQGVEDVAAITNYDGRTLSPFDEVTFSTSEIASREAGLAAFEDGFSNTQEPWHGFLSNITGTVSDGVLNYFVIDVELAKGVSPFAFLRSLEDGTFITGSSTGGIPDDGHLHYRQLSDTEIFVKFPIPFANDDRPTRQPVGLPLP